MMRVFQNFEIISDTVKSWQIGRAIVMAPSPEIAYKMLHDSYHEAVGKKDQYRIKHISGPAILLTERMGKISGNL